MDWNDLQFVLAVAERGGILGGAERLNVHATTVSRRIRQFQKALGVELFEKFRHGVVLTEAGADLVEVARQIHGLTSELHARLEGRDAKLSGVVRLTAVDTLHRHWMKDFAAFQRRYPEIQLELSSGLAMANMTQREADVAVRIAERVPEHLIGARLCPVAHALYASHELLERHGADAPLEALPWVSYDLSVFRGVDTYLAAAYPAARVVLRVPRIDLLAAALEDGVGVGVLQCIAGDTNPRLRRVAPFPDGAHHVWVLTHPQLRGSARVTAVMKLLRRLITRDRALFAGESEPT